MCKCTGTASRYRASETTHIPLQLVLSPVNLAPEAARGTSTPLDKQHLCCGCNPCAPSTTFTSSSPAAPAPAAAGPPRPAWCEHPGAPRAPSQTRAAPGNKLRSIADAVGLTAWQGLISSRLKQDPFVLHALLSSSTSASACSAQLDRSQLPAARRPPAAVRSQTPCEWCMEFPALCRTCAISPAGAKVTSGQSGGSAPSRYSTARAALFCSASTAGRRQGRDGRAGWGRTGRLAAC